MSEKLLESSAISAFCESVAIMLATGIQTDEAVSILGDSLESSHFKSVCNRVYRGLNSGKSLADAMAASKAFPRYAVDMARAGEQSGHTENVLRNLATYYNEEARMFTKIRQAIGYPAALLCVMTVILGFTVAVILPVFTSVYENIAGGMTAGSFASVHVSVVIGWVALGITLVCAIAAVAAAIMCRSGSGRIRFLRFLEIFPFTKQAMYQLAVSRFTSALATYISSGANTDVSMREAANTVEHKALRAKLERACAAMTNLDDPKSLATVIYEEKIFDAVYARMLMIGSVSGTIDDTLNELSDTFFDDAVSQIDAAIDNVEPALAAFLTVAVGATLIAVMLPLIGVMGSIG